MSGGLLKFAKLTGRASRAEFAIVLAIATGLSLIDLVLQHTLPQGVWRNGSMIVLGLLEWWLFLATAVRRMHDLNKSGWLLPLIVVPMVGIIFLLWWLFRPGSVGSNGYDGDVRPIAVVSAG